MRRINWPQLQRFENLRANDGGDLMTESKFQIPFRLAVFVAGENGDLVSGKLRQRLSGIPGLAQGIFDQFGWNFEIHEEIGMGAAEAVVRLSGRER